MMVEERHREILAQLRTARSLSVEETAESCGVSVDTIRRDFRRLAEQGLVKRAHGGILQVEPFARDSANHDRSALCRAEKLRIARHAATLIHPGETVAIDAGTTAIEAIPFLAETPEVTVLTYSLDVARRAVDTGDLQCIMFGGIIRKNTYSAVGPDANTMLRQFQAHTLFLGANAVGAEGTLMTPNRMEAEVKRGLIAIAQRVALLVDSTKLGRRALASFAEISEVDILITDSEADQSQLNRFRDLDVEIVVV